MLRAWLTEIERAIEIEEFVIGSAGMNEVGAPLRLTRVKCGPRAVRRIESLGARRAVDGSVDSKRFSVSVSAWLRQLR